MEPEVCIDVPNRIYCYYKTAAMGRYVFSMHMASHGRKVTLQPPMSPLAPLPTTPCAKASLRICDTQPTS